ncbi:hypothetical protein SUGI_0649340 [Cryptomeria japonica]|uniref:uncharacterized protein LOC131062929 n=1 Tax=Cryptomeria japonica TaxID=3369 RepID=UPI002414B431|nr:uncharacterized protein LOC131062929 [Cryptomeria japonica]GLJ32263.1 hypothetical protein SUGI_0649340 [Cryptomeria japonica]
MDEVQIAKQGCMRCGNNDNALDDHSVLNASCNLESREEKLNLKVIGVGLCRTGTYSLRGVLNMLGFPCYHYSEMRKNNQINLWLDILSGKSEDWKSAFSGYMATVDFPSITVYRKLMELCPEAKIILTVRDTQTWYESVKDTVYRAYNTPGDQSPSQLVLSRLKMWEGLFGGRFEDREYAMSVYEAHVESVKNYVPAHKLLVFNLKEGWLPLCNFLGVPLPPADTPFPHLNKTAQFIGCRFKEA